VSKPHRLSSSSTNPKPTTSDTTVSLYDDIISSKSESPPPLPDHEQDILLVDHQNKRETEDYLSHEIGCPIRLLLSKEITSKTKNNQKYNNQIFANKKIFF
jgi:hypothetical protein